MTMHRVFTITHGRTGTHWLTALFEQNAGPDWVAVHELSGVDDFGTRTPDIRTNRHFNTYGMTPLVRAFWREKLAALPDVPFYFEANHTLAKAGLIEALAEHATSEEITILLVRRNWVPLITSLNNRYDFLHASTYWQWYLDPYAPRLLVESENLIRYGHLGFVVWYVAEMAARQEYYRILYGSRFRFVDVSFEDMTSPDGAQKLLGTFGISGALVLPEKLTDTRGLPNPLPNDPPGLMEQLITDLDFDAERAARAYLETGARLDVPSTQ